MLEEVCMVKDSIWKADMSKVFLAPPDFKCGCCSLCTYYSKFIQSNEVKYVVPNQ
jgi:hypothetical protein